MKQQESILQKSCVNWFRYQYPQYSSIFFAVPNGGHRNPTTARTMKMEGQLAGVSDLILLLPSTKWSGLCIEMKIKPNKQSEHQKKFQSEVEKYGYCYIVCYDYEEFKTKVEEYLQHCNPS
jgi:hypothetical protein